MSTTTYNHLAGRSIDRLAALSDGIFGMAMTLLMLDLRVPTHELIHSDQELWSALAKLTPTVITYLLSFLTLGIFWHGQSVELSHLKHRDRHFSWLQLVFLFVVTSQQKCFLNSLNDRTALICYWLNILFLGATLWGSWRYALRVGLAKDSVSREMISAIDRRIIWAGALRAGRGTLRVKQLLKHRIYRPGPA